MFPGSLIPLLVLSAAATPGPEILNREWKRLAENAHTREEHLELAKRCREQMELYAEKEKRCQEEIEWCGLNQRACADSKHPTRLQSLHHMLSHYREHYAQWAEREKHQIKLAN